jgi:DNA-binding LacI/PurR family transcriptional regulator
VPVVLLDARGAGVPMVVTDDVEGGRIATRHLVALGHERIAFIGEAPSNPFGFTSTALRERGYREVLRAAGIRTERRFVRYGAHDRTVARRLTAALLAKPDRPTAVFAASDVQATGVLAAAADAGLRVPEDLSVVGFDDIEIAAYAGLTTVHQPLFDSGRIATRLLLGHLDAGSHDGTVAGRDQGPWPGRNGNSDSQGVTIRELPLELVERTTTSAPARRKARPKAKQR